MTQILKKILRPFLGKGIGGSLAVKFLFRISIPFINPINLEGDRFYLRPTDIDYLTGNYQKAVRDLFKKEIKKGDVVADIGACTGYMTLLAAKLAGKEGKVMTFEAEPKNFEILLKNAASYENIVPFQAAVTNKAGKEKLYLWKGAHYHRIAGQGDNFVEVSSVKLDDYCQKFDLINIDIAGGEGLAIDGMKEILKKNPQVKIIMDFCPERIEKTGFSPINCLTTLTNLGFKIWRLDHDSLISVPFEEIKALAEEKETKILFCKR